MYTPMYIKVRCKGVYITRICLHDDEKKQIYVFISTCIVYVCLRLNSGMLYRLFQLYVDNRRRYFRWRLMAYIKKLKPVKRHMLDYANQS